MTKHYEALSQTATVEGSGMNVRPRKVTYSIGVADDAVVRSGPPYQVPPLSVPRVADPQAAVGADPKTDTVEVVVTLLKGSKSPINKGGIISHLKAKGFDVPHDDEWWGRFAIELRGRQGVTEVAPDAWSSSDRPVEEHTATQPENATAHRPTPRAEPSEKPSDRSKSSRRIPNEPTEPTAVSLGSETLRGGTGHEVVKLLASGKLADMRRAMDGITDPAAVIRRWGSGLESLSDPPAPGLPGINKALKVLLPPLRARDFEALLEVIPKIPKKDRERASTATLVRAALDRIARDEKGNFQTALKEADAKLLAAPAVRDLIVAGGWFLPTQLDAWITRLVDSEESGQLRRDEWWQSLALSDLLIDERSELVAAIRQIRPKHVESLVKTARKNATGKDVGLLLALEGTLSKELQVSPREFAEAATQGAESNPNGLLAVLVTRIGEPEREDAQRAQQAHILALREQHEADSQALKKLNEGLSQELRAVKQKLAESQSQKRDALDIELLSERSKGLGVAVAVMETMRRLSSEIFAEVASSVDKEIRVRYAPGEVVAFDPRYQEMSDANAIADPNVISGSSVEVISPAYLRVGSPDSVLKRALVEPMH
jgi:hypothetical protein